MKKITELNVPVRAANKVFLGGTCNESTWRDNFITKLQNIEYYNPVVPNWNDEAYQRELKERETANYLLYVITPKMSGVYSICEVIEDAILWGSKTLFCIVNEDEGYTFNESQLQSFEAMKKMLRKYNAMVFDNLDNVAQYLNNPKTND